MLLLDGTRPGLCVQCGQPGLAGAPCGTPACGHAGYACLPEDLGEEHGRPTPDDLHTGRTVDEYILARKLGQGGMGAVFLALQRPIGLKAALKFIGDDVSHDPAAVARFRDEATTLAALNDPHIVRLMKFGIWEDRARHQQRPYLVMEHIGGNQTLAGLIKEGTTIAEALSLVEGIVEGAHAMHLKALVHRDLKPSNIMVQTLASGRRMVRLIDFGIAKNVSSGGHSVAGMGTLAYMPPEQIRARDIGPWSDYYAIGVIAIELLCRRNPFRQQPRGAGTTDPITALLAKEDFGTEAALAFLGPECHPDLLAFVVGALHPSPGARLSDPKAFVAALHRAALTVAWSEAPLDRFSTLVTAPTTPASPPAFAQRLPAPARARPAPPAPQARVARPAPPLAPVPVARPGLRTPAAPIAPIAPTAIAPIAPIAPTVIAPVAPTAIAPVARTAIASATPDAPMVPVVPDAPMVPVVPVVPTALAPNAPAAPKVPVAAAGPMAPVVSTALAPVAPAAPKVPVAAAGPMAPVVPTALAPVATTGFAGAAAPLAAPGPPGPPAPPRPAGPSASGGPRVTPTPPAPGAAPAPQRRPRADPPPAFPTASAPTPPQGLPRLSAPGADAAQRNTLAFFDAEVAESTPRAGAGGSGLAEDAEDDEDLAWPRPGRSATRLGALVGLALAVPALGLAVGVLVQKLRGAGEGVSEAPSLAGAAARAEAPPTGPAVSGAAATPDSDPAGEVPRSERVGRAEAVAGGPARADVLPASSVGVSSAAAGRVAAAQVAAAQVAAAQVAAAQVAAAQVAAAQVAAAQVAAPRVQPTDHGTRAPERAGSAQGAMAPGAAAKVAPAGPTRPRRAEAVDRKVEPAAQATARPQPSTRRAGGAPDGAGATRSVRPASGGGAAPDPVATADAALRPKVEAALQSCFCSEAKALVGRLSPASAATFEARLRACPAFILPGSTCVDGRSEKLR